MLWDPYICLSPSVLKARRLTRVITGRVAPTVDDIAVRAGRGGGVGGKVGRGDEGLVVVDHDECR